MPTTKPARWLGLGACLLLLACQRGPGLRIVPDPLAPPPPETRSFAQVPSDTLIRLQFAQIYERATAVEVVAGAPGQVMWQPQKPHWRYLRALRLRFPVNSPVFKSVERENFAVHVWGFDDEEWKLTGEEHDETWRYVGLDDPSDAQITALLAQARYDGIPNLASIPKNLHLSQPPRFRRDTRGLVESLVIPVEFTVDAEQMGWSSQSHSDVLNQVSLTLRGHVECDIENGKWRAGELVEQMAVRVQGSRPLSPEERSQRWDAMSRWSRGY